MNRNVYCIGGIASSGLVFDNLELNATLHYLPWTIPYKNESLRDYACRMGEGMLHPNSIVVGVSFGGIVAQEISQVIPVDKVIIISSVKSQKEFPLFLKFLKMVPLHRIIKPSLLLKYEVYKYFLRNGKKMERLKRKYMTFTEDRYLNWAVDNIINWDPQYMVKNIYHLHGDRDTTFPISKIRDRIVIKGGTHLMIIKNHKQISQKVNEIILS